MRTTDPGGPGVLRGVGVKYLAAFLTVAGVIAVAVSLFLIDPRALVLAAGAVFVYLGLVVVEVER